MDDEGSIAGQVHLGAQVHGDAAPALKLVGVWGTVRHAAILVVVVEAAGARHVVVGFGAAAQALAVATLPLVCTGQLAVFGAYWGKVRETGRRSVSIGREQSVRPSAITTKSRMTNQIL